MVLAITMNAGYPLWLAAGAALGVSLLVGFINGVLIAYLRIF
jgi:ribose transport system permease protein